MEDIVEKLEFGCPFKHGTIGEKDAERAEVWMQEGADEMAALKAGDDDVFCTMRFNEATGDFEVVEPSGDTATLQSVLTRARADYEEFEKAKAHISGDRLGSYTLYGQWTLTADLTQEEIANHHYRTALERGRAEALEEAAKIAETVYADEDLVIRGTGHDIAAHIRAAKGE